MTRVPLIGPRGRIKVIADQPVWVYQTMDATLTFTQVAPRTASTVASELDPTISAGRAEYTALTEGGLFDILSKAGKGYVISAVDNVGNAALTIKHVPTGTSRPWPTELPVYCGPGECPVANNGVAATPLGFLVQEIAPER